jgi:hypothetical protein
VNGAEGTARAEFSVSQTAAFVEGQTYIYDAVATMQDGRVVPLGRGEFRARTLVSID